MSHPYGRFEPLLKRARRQGAIPAAVVYPLSGEALAGALEARAAGLIRPILVGPPAAIRRLARDEGLDIGACALEEAATAVAAARRGAQLARAGVAGVLMKGSLHTDELMGVVVSRQAGLRTARRVSHVFVVDVPGHDRLLLVSDCAVNIAPKLKAKADIVRNAIDFAHAIGIAAPRVALLSAVETVNPAIPSTVDARALRDMAARGEISGAALDGPLAFDNAVSREAARVKGIASPVAGVADILIVPSLEAGNILYKSLVYMGHALAAGVVLGMRVPVILTSRADSAASRTVSAAVACLLVHYLKEKA